MDWINPSTKPHYVQHEAQTGHSTTMLEVMRLAQQMFSMSPLRVLGAHAIQVMWLGHRLAQAAGMYQDAASSPTACLINSLCHATPGPRTLTPLQVMWAGLLHDLGKLDLPAELIDKPAALTPDEQGQMRSHALLGYQRVSELAQRWPHAGIDQTVLSGILHHHERFDGQGYPMGLAGEGIPPLARILAVADVYSALTASRPYRAAWTREQALHYLQEQQGLMFDPALTHLVPDVFREEPPVNAPVTRWQAGFPGGIY